MGQVVVERPNPPVTSMVKLAGQEMSDTHRRRLRDALGGFATGVTLVLSKCDNDYHGMTANSFSAVSLSPPLILVSIANGAKAAEVIRQTRRFSVNLLSKSQQEISTHFAGRPSEMVSPNIEWTVDGTPYLDGALGTFLCNLYRSYEAGDHTIFVGEVEEYQHALEEPLLFFRGKYTKLSN